MRHFEWVPDTHSNIKLNLGQIPTGWLDAFSFAWLNAFGEAAGYLPIVIPFALATIVGGIDLHRKRIRRRRSLLDQSSHRSGSDRDNRRCTMWWNCTNHSVYWHPAYKAMGGRAAYTLATAVAIGLLGTLGIFGYFYLYIHIRPSIRSSSSSVLKSPAKVF